MLGLGSSITSGVPESKYSASFDGTEDYIDFGNVNNLGVGDFSFSFWVKFSEATSQNLISKYYDSDNRWFIRTQGTDKIQFLARVGASTVMDLSYSGSAISEDAWHHVVVTCDRSESDGLKIYLDNSAGTAGAGSTTDIDNTGDVYIGRQNTAYGASILHEVGIWNVALSAAAVTAIYNSGSPLNLKFDQGNYNNSSALQGYYRMGNGFFDDKANGVIHDQDNPGFGSELNDGTWTAHGGWSISNGVATNDGSGSTIVNDVLTDGKVYKITAKLSSYSSGNFSLFLGVGTQSGQFNGTDRVTFIGRCSGDTVARIKSSSGVGSVNISDISIKELNGNPGLTSGGVTFSSDTP